MKGLSIALAVCFCVLSHISQAQTAEETIEQFVERRAVELLDAYPAAGLVVALVKPDGSTFAEGFGVSDTTSGARIDARRDLFQAASITKTFTAVALMTLVEDGRIDLDAPIRKYLPPDFPLSDRFDDPIRVRDLLAHRAGFEVVQFGAWPGEARNVVSLDAYLRTSQPLQVHPPGQVTVYSNYGYGLAGRIIEHVSGRSFEDYVEEHVFRPLGMSSTTVRQPIGDNRPFAMRRDLRDRLARGHRAVAGDITPRNYVFTNTPPAGSAATTAVDMAAFMQDFLKASRGGAANVFTPEILTAMSFRLYQDRRFSVDFGAGVEIRPFRGYNLIGHEGDIFYTKSYYALIPELNIGAFVSVLGDQGTDVAFTLVEDALLKMAGGPNPRSGAVSDNGAVPAPFEGRFITEYRSHSTFEKFILLAWGAQSIGLNAAGVLSVGDSPEAPVRLAPALFEEPEDGRRILLDVGDDGAVERVYLGAGAFVPVMLTSDPLFFKVVAGLAFLAALVSLIVAFVAAVRPWRGASGSRRIALATIVGAAVSVLVSVGLLAFAMIDFGANFPDSMLTYPAGPISAFVYWNYAMALAVGVSLIVIPLTLKSDIGVAVRSVQIVQMPVFITLVIVFHWWHMIGPNFSP